MRGVHSAVTLCLKLMSIFSKIVIIFINRNTPNNKILQTNKQTNSCGTIFQVYLL